MVRLFLFYNLRKHIEAQFAAFVAVHTSVQWLKVGSGRKLALFFW
jgi:hypothetical protein